MTSPDSGGLVRDFLSRNLSRPNDLPLVAPSKNDAVRSFMITQGRTTSAVTDLGFETLLSLTDAGRMAESKLLFERREIAGCLGHQSLSVAEIAVALSVPLGVAMVLCGDMIVDEVIEAHRASMNVSEDVSLIQRLIHGVRAL